MDRLRPNPPSYKQQLSGSGLGLEGLVFELHDGDRVAQAREELGQVCDAVRPRRHAAIDAAPKSVTEQVWMSWGKGRMGGVGVNGPGGALGDLVLAQVRDRVRGRAGAARQSVPRAQEEMSTFDHACVVNPPRVSRFKTQPLRACARRPNPRRAVPYWW